MTPGFRLSPLQEAHWRTSQAEPRFPWSTSLTLAVRGPLDPGAVGQALEALVQRHEILRTRFVRASGEGEVLQAVEPRGRAGFELHDWSAKDAAERELACRELEHALRATYPLDGSAPLRAALVTLGPGEHRLVLAQAALAADWRSLWSLTRELARALAGQRHHDEPVQFAELAQWLHDTLEGEDAAAGLAFWKTVDLAAAADLRLALEHDRGPRPFTVQEVRRTLSAGARASLEALAQARALPAEALLCAAFQALLARVTERAELVIGVRSAGRAFQGLDEALGPFERFLPCGAAVDGKVSLLALARRADEHISAGAEWHEFFRPEALGARPDFSFRQAFEYLPAEPALELAGRRFEILRRDGQAEPFRALLRAEERPDALALSFVYDPRHLAEMDVEVLAGQFVTLLENALARPEAPIASLSPVSAAERARILGLARGPALAPDARCVHERVLACARAHPDAVAVSASGVELGYASLARRSAALAAELCRAGVGPGSLVGIHLERSVELVVALLAVLRAGGAYVPLPPSYPAERVRTMLEDCAAAVVVGSGASAAALEGFRGRIVRADLAAATGAEPTEARLPEVSGADLAYVIYTSGSTGKPKGVPVSHANLAYSTRAREAHYERPVQRYLLLSSFAFDSSVAGLFWTLVQGGTLLLPGEGFERDLAQLPGLIARGRPTHLLTLPSLWSLVLEQAHADEIASLETVIVAGESCPPELVRRHRSQKCAARLHNEYGPTEGTVWSTVFDAGTPLERPQVPIGRPIPGSSNYVLGPDRELAPLGVAGELWIAGPGVVQGYLHRPELTAERFAEDPFAPPPESLAPDALAPRSLAARRMYRTGDRARLLPDGNLEFLGRLDGQVKVRGYRIELQEIESVLAAHPAVGEALVLAREDGAGGQRLVAYVTPVGPPPTETDLLRFLAECLPAYMVPARAVALASWPLLPNGKVDRRALPEPADPNTYVEPEGALEVVLAALWADVLQVEQVGRHDDFFTLGGHSLSATRLYARLRDTLQIALPLRALFEHRTPAALAAELCRDPAERARVEQLAAVVLSVLEADDEEHALGA